MRDLHKLGIDKNWEKKTTLEEDLAWWSVVNLFSNVVYDVSYFDNEMWMYRDIRFVKRIPSWALDSYSGSVTMAMIRTNSAKIVEELAVQFVSKK
jgi:hypothetical protein